MVVGKVDGPLCLVSAVLEYLVARGVGTGPLFHFRDGTPLTRNRLVEQVRRGSSNVDSALYSGHSFRIGAATT